jgi:hypothetical protein
MFAFKRKYIVPCVSNFAGINEFLERGYTGRTTVSCSGGLHQNLGLFRCMYGLKYWSFLYDDNT